MIPIEVLHNQTQVNQAIFETEKEIANKILFSSAPKNYGKNSIKENYPYPYYDSTYSSKVNQISILKNKVQFLKSQINEDKEELKKYAINNNTLSNKMNYRNNDQNKDAINMDSNKTNDNQETNKINNNNYNNNNILHLFVLINNQTYPRSLSELENNLNLNSHNYTEKNITYDDLLKEQMDTVDNLYEKRKNQLIHLNNEMKKNITDIHDKK